MVTEVGGAFGVGPGRGILAAYNNTGAMSAPGTWNIDGVGAARPDGDEVGKLAEDGHTSFQSASISAGYGAAGRACMAAGRCTRQEEARYLVQRRKIRRGNGYAVRGIGMGRAESLSVIFRFGETRNETTSTTRRNCLSRRTE